MPSRATQDRRVMVESSDKMWSTGEQNGKPLQYSCLESHVNSMKRKKYRTLKDEHSNSKRYMHTSVHGSTVYNNQDMEAT